MSASALILEKNMKLALDAGFAAAFGGEPERYFSAPGRTEIGGNHTDHQRGRVLAGAVNLDKENIGLIEVMGLAVLPSRLNAELHNLAEALVAGRDIASDEVLRKHASWVEELKKQYTFTAENALEIILQETGHVFSKVLEDAGVYKNTEEGYKAFMCFVDAVNSEL